MIYTRFFWFSVGVAGFAALVYATVRRNPNLEVRQFDNELSTWEFEGGNLAPSETLPLPKSVATQETNKGSRGNDEQDKDFGYWGEPV